MSSTIYVNQHVVDAIINSSDYDFGRRAYDRVQQQIRDTDKLINDNIDLSGHGDPDAPRRVRQLFDDRDQSLKCQSDLGAFLGTGLRQQIFAQSIAPFLVQPLVAVNPYTGDRCGPWDPTRESIENFKATTARAGFTVILGYPTQGRSNATNPRAAPVTASFLDSLSNGTNGRDQDDLNELIAAARRARGNNFGLADNQYRPDYTRQTRQSAVLGSAPTGFNHAYYAYNTALYNARRPSVHASEPAQPTYAPQADIRGPTVADSIDHHLTNLENNLRDLTMEIDMSTAAGNTPATAASIATTHSSLEDRFNKLTDLIDAHSAALKQIESVQLTHGHHLLDAHHGLLGRELPDVMNRLLRVENAILRIGEHMGFADDEDVAAGAGGAGQN